MSSTSSHLVDRFGRRIDYLRISVTERCDLRCAYCCPQGASPLTRRDVLTGDHVADIARAALGLGIRRLRLTGGEPLLRDDLVDIVSRLRAMPDLRDLALTTNGGRLAGLASDLAAAGLRRVNISLDSLDPQTYAAATGGGDLAPVLRGVDAALAAGLHPVKINVVLTSGAVLDQDRIPAFAALVQRLPVHVRFIEAMPTCTHVGYVPAQQVLDRLAREGDFVSVPGPEGGGPARYYRMGDSPGTIGLIAPLSAPFCDRCNRLRVTARGQLIPCLFSPRALDLMPALDGPDPVSALASLITDAVAAKPARYGDVAEPSGIRAMHIIGG
jgi:cyclic pyranopterin phosphate synthase